MCSTTQLPAVAVGYSVARDGDRFAVKEFAFVGDRLGVRIHSWFASQTQANQMARLRALRNKVAFIGLEQDPASQQTA